MLTNQDMKKEVLGEVSRHLVGEKLVPKTLDLLPPEGFTAMGFCTQCGRLTYLDLRYANLFASQAGISPQTTKSLSGKYFQMDACMRCSTAPELDTIELVDIPRSA